MKSNAPTPDTPNAYAMAMADEWEMIDALLGGTRAMRDGGFIPQWPNEDAKSYENRLSLATLFPAFKRTVEVLASKPFSEPIALSDDIPEEIKGWLENCDLQGCNIQAFATNLFTNSLAFGMAGILVAFPPVKKKKPKTKAEEKQAGLRPYFVHIQAKNILGWKCQTIDGIQVLSQLRLLESVTEDAGPFSEKQVTQVRVLYQTSYEVWRKNEKGDWFIFENGVNTLGKIPFVPVATNRTGFMTAECALADLAYLNVDHFQSKSDQQTILHVARVPILTVIGGDDNAVITVGTAAAVNLPLGAEMKFVEHSGLAIEAGRQSLQDLEENMRQIGAELLVLRQIKATATQIDSEDEGHTCSLKQMAEDLEDALDAALQLMAEWSKLPTGGNVSVFKDFGAGSLAEASISLLRDLSIDGLLSKPSLFDEIKRRNIISPELNYADEQVRVKEFGSVSQSVQKETP